ncbi:MAG: DUF1844 domain-containing protein [Armatimonadetes bacterium]|nr:DUF1844 domain-containing protein [Armatimonadota bacterium]
MASTDENTPKGPLNTFEFLAIMCEQLASVAWSKMGLQPDLLSGQIHKDPVQAKAAVDAYAALTEILSPQLEDEDKRRVQNLLRDLRVNYVEHSKEG